MSHGLLLDLQSCLLHDRRKLNHLNHLQSPLGIEICFDEYYRDCGNGFVVNTIDDVKTDLGCGCDDVGSENPAAIRKFLFQSSTSRCLMLWSEEDK